MATQRHPGARIRERRLDLGLRQAAVAQQVGISASYLNLIEHDRRRIGGKLLADIAQVLGVSAVQLTDGADGNVLNRMRSAAAASASSAELQRAEELAARFPGWAQLIVEQAQQIQSLNGQLQVAKDRMTYDPDLARSLHDVISSVTAIRSTAGILVSDDALDADWRRRFHQNIHNDSLRLAENSEALVAYLEAPETQDAGIGSPLQQRDAYLQHCGFHLAAIETGGRAAIDAVLAASGLQGDAMAVLRSFAVQYATDAQLLPLDVFEQKARDCGYDPAQLAQAFGAPFDVVLRRLAALPPDAGHPHFGLAVSDGAGVVTMLKPVHGFAMTYTTAACPLWPLFTAKARPSQPIRQEICLPSAPRGILLCYAIATAGAAAHFDMPPPITSTMLVMPDAPPSDRPPVEVGVTCRICPRDNCPSRREPAIDGFRANG